MTAILDRSEIIKTLPEAALFVGGEKVTKTTAGTMQRIDPTTGQFLADFPIAGTAEVDRAVAAAKKAFPAWKRMPADKRRQLLFDVSLRLQAADTEFKVITALESGTPVGGNRAMSMAVDHLQYYSGWTDKLAGEVVHTYPGRALDYVKYEPYGVVGALVTWNAPLTTSVMKLAPALAAGNCVVVKSPELGPFASMRLAEIFQEAGLPDGVLSVLTGGPEVGEAIIRHPDVLKISFTGGPATATKVIKAAAESITPVVLELGGKSANLVFADADLDAAATMGAFMSTIALAGQGCNFPTRLIVHDSVYDEMLERVKVITEAQQVGDPLNDAVTMGPVVSAAAVDRIMGYIDEAKEGPSRLLTGGHRMEGEFADGFFIEPTIFADVDNSSRLAQEEVFGPVLSVLRFSDDDEAVRIANDSRFGLGAYLYTKDLSRAHRVAEDLDAGYIGVNSFPWPTASMPYGGVKASGFGREGGRAGIQEYLTEKNIYIPLD